MNNVHESERVTAFHEAAHCVAGFLVGRPLEVVSIRAGAGYAGICVQAGVDTSGLEIRDVPALLQHDDVLRHAIASMTISLAGPLGSELAGYRPEGYVRPTHDELIASARAHALVGLEPRHRVVLIEAERDTKPLTSDEDSAAGMSAAAMGEAVAGAFLSFMWAATRELVHSPPFVALVDVLVPELLANKVVPGQRAAELFDATGIWRKGKKKMTMSPIERQRDLELMAAQDKLAWMRGQRLIDDEEYERRRAELDEGER